MRRHSESLAARLTALVESTAHPGPRPYQVRSDIRLCGDPLDPFSFPSGHTLHALCFTSIVTAPFPALAPLLVPFTFLVALSRVVLGLHYPSDVLAGAVLGSAVAGAALIAV